MGHRDPGQVTAVARLGVDEAFFRGKCHRISHQTAASGEELLTAVDDLAAGTYGEEVYVLDAANGGMALLDTPNISDEGRAAVDAARAAIADGSVTVPETPTEEEVQALIDG